MEHRVAIWSFSVFNTCVHPVSSARDLDVYVDDDMTMTTNINHVLSSCISALRQIRSIKQSLPSHALDTLVTSLAHSRLDYCNVVFAGLPARDLQRPQSVLNAAVWLVSIHQVAVMSHPCYRIVTGCPSDSVCSTSYACWLTAVCMEKHHLISPSSSSRPPSQTTKLVWGQHSHCPSLYHILTQLSRSPSLRLVLGTTSHRT